MLQNNLLDNKAYMVFNIINKEKYGLKDMNTTKLTAVEIDYLISFLENEWDRISEEFIDRKKELEFNNDNTYMQPNKEINIIRDILDKLEYMWEDVKFGDDLTGE